MAALNNAQVLAAQVEKVIPALKPMYEIDDSIITKVKRKGEIVSNRAARVTLKMRPGGRFGMYNPDGGGLGRGTATDYEVLQVSPSHFKESVEATKLAQMATDSSDKAVLNAVKEEMKNIVVEFKVQQEKAFFRGPTGQLGIFTSAVGTVWLLTADTAYVPSQKFRVGEGLTVVDTTITTLRTGTPVVTAIDDVNNKITVDANPAGIVATDKIFYEGITLDLVGHTASGGLNGITTFHDDSQSGTYLSLNRANFPELWTPSVDAASALLAIGNLRLGLNKVRMALGSDAAKGITFVLHPGQAHSYEDLGQLISEINKAGGNQSLDLLFGDLSVAGMPTIQSINQDRTRIDALSIESLGRTVLQEVDMFKVGDTTVFPIYAADGSPAASLWFALTTSFQLYHENPRRGFFIKNLAKLTGY
jgi:hypothetical protein